MVGVILAIFIFGSLALWLSAFGYLIILILLARCRHPESRPRTHTALPEVAVVIPTLDEEEFVVGKLHNLRDSCYPREHVRITVVDGGSRDRTRSLVRDEIQRDASIQLLCLAGRGQAGQVDYALRVVPQEIVIVTDADASLDRRCIRELVAVLLEDPETALVGAQVQPVTALMEERLHWRLINAICKALFALKPWALRQLLRRG